jgi:hypothetical protein
MADATPSLWEYAEKILLGFVSLLVYVWGRERKSIDDKITRVESDLVEFKHEVRERFAKAGEHTSDLATAVQGIPERLRKEWREDFDREHQRHRRDDGQ